MLLFLPRFSAKAYCSYDELLPDLQKHMLGYEKTKRYFTRTNLYCYLIENGDIKLAIENPEKLCELSKANPEDEASYSEIYQLIKLLNELEPV